MEENKGVMAFLESESIFRYLVEQIPAVVYIDLADESGKTIFISSYIFQMLGYSPGDWLDKPELCKDLIHPHDRERVSVETQMMNDSGR